MRKYLILVLFLIILTSAVKDCYANEFDGTYYGYGDSIMKGDHVGNPDRNVFIPLMVDLYDPNNVSERNVDGGGKDSKWAYETFSAHCYLRNYIIETFGVNDKRHGRLSGEESAQYKLQMYNYSVEGNSESYYMPCINVLGSPYRWESMKSQYDRIHKTEDLFNDYCIRFCPLYDAIDSDPWNGRVDNWDYIYYDDEVHPAINGNRLMADLLWYFIKGYDHNVSYNQTMDHLSLYVDYNETVHVDKLTDWSYDDVIVYCNTTFSLVDWEKNKDIRGNDKISIICRKGYNYTIRETYNLTYNDESDILILKSNYPEQTTIDLRNHWNPDDVIILTNENKTLIDANYIKTDENTTIVNLKLSKDLDYIIRETYNVTHNKEEKIIYVISKHHENISVEISDQWEDITVLNSKGENVSWVKITNNEQSPILSFTGFGAEKYFILYDIIEPARHGEITTIPMLILITTVLIILIMIYIGKKKQLQNT